MPQIIAPPLINVTDNTCVMEK